MKNKFIVVHFFQLNEKNDKINEKNDQNILFYMQQTILHARVVMGASIKIQKHKIDDDFEISDALPNHPQKPLQLSTVA